MNIIFDFDGTLADTLEIYVEIANEYLTEQGMTPVTKEEVQKKGIKRLIKERNIKIHEIPKLLLYGRKKLKNKIPKVELFKGIKNVVEKLHVKHTLGILTSNSVENVEFVLKKNDIDNLFDFIYSEFNLFGKDKKLKNIFKRYKLEKSKTVYIGDETRDVEAAKKAGVRSAAVAWGYESVEVLKKAHPDKIINNPQEFSDLISIS